jgi:hypothetical protein
MPLNCKSLFIGLLAISRIKRRAIGFMARPESPEMVCLPSTEAQLFIVTLLKVLTAEMPSAPAKWAAKAGCEIWVMLGVIFGMTGILTLCFTCIKGNGLFPL